MTDLRQLPSDLDTERTVLASLFERPDLLAQAEAMLEPGDFWDARHRIIFGAMAKAGSGFHSVSICRALNEEERLEDAGGSVYIAGLIGGGWPLLESVEDDCRRLVELAERRRLIRDTQSLLTDLHRVPLAEARQSIAESLSSIRLSEANAGPRKLEGDLMRVFERWQRAEETGEIQGLGTGFPDIDRILTGLLPGQLVTLAARPGQGKSALALGIARHQVAWGKRRVAFFSLEMSGEELAQRLVCADAQVDSRDAAEGRLCLDDWRRIARTLSDWADLPLLIDDTPRLGLADLAARIRALKASEGGLDLVIVDYLQLLATPKRQNRHEEIGALTRGLKLLAKAEGLPILLLSQLNRAVEGRRGSEKRPRLSDLRGSGQIEEDSDAVVFLHRAPDEFGVTEVFIEKQRNGPTGAARIMFLDRTVAFESLAHSWDEGATVTIP